eukprot:gene1928-2363_t
MNFLKRPITIVGGYIVSVNVGAMGLFYYDKQQAIQHKWRVRESTLQLTALFGGWIGGMFAMQKFKHKRAKQSFKNVYFTAVAANVGIVGAFVAVLKFRPQLLPYSIRNFFQTLKNQNNQHFTRPRHLEFKVNHNNTNNNNFKPTQEISEQTTTTERPSFNKNKKRSKQNRDQ